MPKRKRESTAAYAASQPLFDALREACEKLELQKSNLLLARDLVQSLHVKLQHVDLTVGDKSSPNDNHGRYLDSTLAAWTTAIDSYRDIFAQLVSLTAAEPETGKEATDHHESFKNILRSASEAKHTVTEIVSARQSLKRQTLDHKPGKVEGQDDTANERPQFSHPPGSSEKTIRPSKLRKRNVSSAKASDDHHDTHTVAQPSESIPAATNTADIEASGSTEHHPKPAKVFVKDGVKYEDVSAEVTARLQAKQEKRASEKVKHEKKKRKRESTDSVSNTNAKRSHAATSPVKDLPERPRGKKSKRNSSVTSDQRPERNDTGQSRKKRRSAKETEAATDPPAVSARDVLPLSRGA
jgi:hypothetical protein